MGTIIARKQGEKTYYLYHETYRQKRSPTDSGKTRGSGKSKVCSRTVYLGTNDDGLFIGFHPHSGIGIITYFEGGHLHHDDTGNNKGVIRGGGVQWIPYYNF